MRMARLGLAAAFLTALAGCAVVDRVEDTFTEIGEAFAPSPDGGVGLIGTVTATLPDRTGVEVNGVTVNTTPDTVLRLGTQFGTPLEQGAVPTGMVVEIAAERSAGRLVARQIEPIFVLAGPVQAVDRDGRRLRVMNVDVMIEPDAVLPRGGMRAFRRGQRVAVSGLWRGENVVASRIDFRTPKGTAPAMVSGVVTPRPGARYAIGGVPLAAEFGNLRPGFFHVLEGDWVVDTLLVDDMRFGRTVVGTWPIEVLTVEGYGRARDFAGFYSGYPGPDRGGYFEGYVFTHEEGKLGANNPAWRDHWIDLEGLGRPVDDDDGLDEFENTRAIFVGDYEGGYEGEFDVDYVIPVPDGLAARRSTLSAVGSSLEPQAGVVEVR